MFDIEKDDFTVWQPNCVGIIKGGDDKPRIGGFASTEAEDRQNEQVLQSGLDFSEFVQYGFYNDNHQQHTSAVVGVPDLAEYRKGGGWWTEGYLLKGVQRATEILQLAKALEGTERKLGFSIEGKILERMGNKIVRALIRNVAITNSPVNIECTWGLITKSWASDIDMKALSVGHARSASTGGRVLVPEDLENDEIKYIYKCPHCQKAFGSTLGLDGHLDKAHHTGMITADKYPSIRRSAHEFSRDEAINHIRKLRPEYSQEIATRIVDLVLSQPE